MDKKYFKVVFKEFNSGHTIEIRKGKIFFVGRIDTYRVTGFCETLDDCLEKSRNMVTNMPEWLKKAIG